MAQWVSLDRGTQRLHNAGSRLPGGPDINGRIDVLLNGGDIRETPFMNDPPILRRLHQNIDVFYTSKKLGTSNLRSHLVTKAKSSGAIWRDSESGALGLTRLFAVRV